MVLKNEIKVGGSFLFAKKVNGEDVLLSDVPSKNLILDAFFDSFNNSSISDTTSHLTSVGGSGIGASFRVGTGSTEPATTDVALVSPVLHTSNVSVQNYGETYDVGTDSYTATKTVRAEFAAAAQVYNLTEVAVYTNSSGTNTSSEPILSRSLIKDAEGVPTSLSLQVGEILVLFYTFTCTRPRTVTSTKTIKGVSTLIEFKHQSNSSNNYFPFSDNGTGFTALSSALNYRTTDFTFPSPYTNYSMSGWTAQNSAITNTSAVNPAVGWKRRRRIGLAYANSATLHGLSLTQAHNSNQITWLVKFTPAIEKTDQEVIDMEFITTIARS